MKKVMLLLSAIICITSFSSCADVPNEVIEDMNSYHDGERMNSGEFDFTYINTSGIAKNVEFALSQKYAQFEISDKIRFIQPDEIYVMSFSQTEGFKDRFQDAMELFFPSSVIESQTISDIDEEYDKYFMFSNDKDKVFGCVCDDGFISMLDTDAYDISFNYDEPNVGIYHAERNDDLSDEYQLKDKSCSVAETVEFVNNWFEANYKEFSPEFDYKVETVIVREHEGKYLYEILAHATYKGVALDSYTREMNSETNNMRMTYTDYGIQIQMIKSNEIASFTNLTGIYKPIEVEKIDECISLDSALRLCENTFADFKNMTISDIGIMYTLVPVYETISEEKADGSFNKEIIVRYDSHPVWEFVIDLAPSDFLKEGEINTYGVMRNYIYVDMITGELKYNFENMLR